MGYAKIIFLKNLFPGALVIITTIRCRWNENDKNKINEKIDNIQIIKWKESKEIKKKQL